MEENQVSKAEGKLFAGFLLTSELRMHLNSNPEWKNLSIMPEASKELLEVHYADHHYIGQYLKEDKLTSHEVKTYEDLLLKRLMTYSPKFNTAHLKFFVIAQLLVH